MGIQDRDYMRPAGQPRHDSPGERLEAFFGRWLRRYPRLPWVAAGLLAALLLCSLVLALLAD